MNIKTPQDFGLVIRERRLAKGWDQATLAREVGVSRQWIIDIEKGKPRAELELALRALRVLGASLVAWPTRPGIIKPRDITAAFDIGHLVSEGVAMPTTRTAKRLADLWTFEPDKATAGRTASKAAKKTAKSAAAKKAVTKKSAAPKRVR